MIVIVDIVARNVFVYMQRSDLRSIPRYRLPEHFSFQWYQPGDEQRWIVAVGEGWWVSCNGRNGQYGDENTTRHMMDPSPEQSIIIATYKAQLLPQVPNL